MGLFRVKGRQLRNKHCKKKNNNAGLSILIGINKKTHHVLICCQLVVPVQHFKLQVQ